MSASNPAPVESAESDSVRPDAAAPAAAASSAGSPRTEHAASVRVALVQVASSTEPAENRARLERLVPAGHDLVVLPEAFARDFGSAGSDVSADAEPIDGSFGQELARVARVRATTVVAGMFERSADPTRPWNTLLARGDVRAEYRKIHLYDSFGYRESDRISAGSLTPSVTPWRGTSLGLMTCYDLRFPELARSLASKGATIVVAPAAWVTGERKVEHWRTLVRARAIENTVWMVAVGQPGPRYTGHSLVVSPEGDIVAEAGEGEQTLSVDLDLSLVARARATNPSLANRRL